MKLGGSVERVSICLWPRCCGGGSVAQGGSAGRVAMIVKPALLALGTW